MPGADDFKILAEQEQLHEILMKIVAYQRSLAGGRAVELDELLREDVLSPANADFLTSHSVTYKPHRLSDYHAGDMFHMPTDDGGCVFIGPGGPPLIKRSASLGDFWPIVQSFLRLPRPSDELLLHIEFTKHDGICVSPEMICFDFQSANWRERLPAIRGIAADFGFHPLQDEVVQGSHVLTFSISPDASRTAKATVTFLSCGCGFTNETEVVYSAGALDAT